jgi:hypothetical protein
MFLDNKTGDVQTYATVSNDRGQTFGPVMMINGTGTEPRQTKIITQTDFGFDVLQDSAENTQIAASGNNVYALVWDKEPGNWDVFLSRSTDNGETFEDAINLSNSMGTRSDEAFMIADGDNVYVTWWENNLTSHQPVMRVSNDNGETFGPILTLTANGTIGAATGDEGEGEETT